jgi:hypothetical protein
LALSSPLWKKFLWYATLHCEGEKSPSLHRRFDHASQQQP